MAPPNTGPCCGWVGSGGGRPPHMGVRGYNPWHFFKLLIASCAFLVRKRHLRQKTLGKESNLHYGVLWHMVLTLTAAVSPPPPLHVANIFLPIHTSSGVARLPFRGEQIINEIQFSLPRTLKRGSGGVTPGNFLKFYFAVGEF